MKSQYFDPNLKNIVNGDEDIVEDDAAENDIVEHEEPVETEEEVIDGEEHEWVNPTDLDAVDPDDIGIGEEYF